MGFGLETETSVAVLWSLKVVGIWKDLVPAGAGIVQKYKPNLPKGWKSLTIKGVGVEKKTFVIKN